MDEKRMSANLFNGHPDGNRRAGRPKGRWNYAIELDLKTLGVNDCRLLAGNRPDWRGLLEEEARTDRRLQRPDT